MLEEKTARFGFRHKNMLVQFACKGPRRWEASSWLPRRFERPSAEPFTLRSHQPQAGFIALPSFLRASMKASAVLRDMSGWARGARLIFSPGSFRSPTKQSCLRFQIRKRQRSDSKRGRGVWGFCRGFEEEDGVTVDCELCGIRDAAGGEDFTEGAVERMHFVVGEQA